MVKPLTREVICILGICLHALIKPNSPFFKIEQVIFLCLVVAAVLLTDQLKWNSVKNSLIEKILSQSWAEWGQMEVE